MKRVLLVLIRGYQLVVSPLLGPRCRFYPSCSRYGYQAIERHGCIRGIWLTIRRLLRCHPWNPGGIDEVPPPRSVDQGNGPRSRGGRLSGLHLVPSRESESSALARVQCHEGAAR